MLRCFRLLLPVAFVIALAMPARAEPVRALYDALRLEKIMDVVAEEGRIHAGEIGEALLGGRVDQAWGDSVEELYERDRMRARFLPPFEEELARAGDDAVQEMLDFLLSARGIRIIGLEISAREALLDEEVEESARAAVETLRAEEPERMAQIDRFVEANGLIEENVVGALNASIAFYRGLAESGAPGFDLPAEMFLAEVWSREPEIREETEDWLYGFLALAYGPLATEDLEAYVAFSETGAGQRLNTALFLGFSAVFESISHDLGRAAGRALTGSDI
ncbi:hypothetical protein [Alkalilacustris brevis]|uniref:hypothetical protein n=1 Tax=Alkalilacustris brevis TaxID=2026338 RepID=UPI000E0D09F1|nr:hypothetical protein [Alkalilacustris brevis]